MLPVWNVTITVILLLENGSVTKKDTAFCYVPIPIVS